MMKTIIFSKDKSKLYLLVSMNIAIAIGTFIHLLLLNRLLIWLIFNTIFDIIYCTIFVDFIGKQYFYKYGVISINENDNTILLTNWAEKKKHITSITGACVIEVKEHFLFDDTMGIAETYDYDDIEHFDQMHMYSSIEKKILKINDINVAVEDIKDIDYNILIDFFKKNQGKYSIKVESETIFRDYRYN